MSDNVDNLILEQLRGVRSDVATRAAQVDALTLRRGPLEARVAGLRRDLAPIHVDMAIMSHRLCLRERRLERIEEPRELVA
jgi:hypothetical protein